MKLNKNAPTDLLYAANFAEEFDEASEDSYGVGALMPYDMPEFVFSSDAELYGA